VSANSANSANAGNSGNADSIGNSTSASAGWFFADRVDLPFVTVRSGGTFIQQNRLAPASFPDQNWSADWFAWRVLLEFAAIPTWAGPPTDPGPYPASAAVVSAEIDDLVRAAQDERSDALGEILGQSNEFISYFMNLMTTAPASYPKTARVLNAAGQVALFAVMYWKDFYKRPRPSQLCPALLPPIAVPGHASYPSGHSTQAHLMALCMGQVFSGIAAAAPFIGDLTALADRIARNREIAGLHYPSDSAAGKTLAANLLTQLNTLGSGSLFNTTIAAAAAEWSSWL
jgi:membrane-associated phospholipid phosphatase